MKTSSQTFTAVYEKRGKWFIAFIEEIPGVNTQGKTLAEAKKNLRQALEIILATNRMLTRSELKSSKIIRQTLSI